MSEFSVRDCVAALEEYTVETVAADIIVNANESNYPLPKELGEALAARTAAFPFNRYPPMKSENLSEVIAAELDVAPECVRIGNGSSELLEKLCFVYGGAGKKIAVPWPSFSMYGEYAELSDSEAIRYPLTPEGFIDPDTVINFCEKYEPALLIICNPNNPTGNYNSLSAMEKIIANVKCPVIMDEAYMEFADGREVPPNDMRPLEKIWLVAGSTLSLVNKYTNLIVLRTFSKAYSMAGMRIGYCVGAQGLVRQMGKAIMPYSVNAYSLFVAKMVYENKLLFKEQIKEVKAEREKMAAYLKKLGFYVFPSGANFVCVRAEGDMVQKLAAVYDRMGGKKLPTQAASGKAIFKYLMTKSILIRDFSEHPVLQGCLRISIGLPEENIKILSAITELCTMAEGE